MPTKKTTPKTTKKTQQKRAPKVEKTMTLAGNTEGAMNSALSPNIAWHYRQKVGVSMFGQ